MANAMSHHHRSYNGCNSHVNEDFLCYLINLVRSRKDYGLTDQETVDAPRQSNGRLLLSLKGSLNEYELDLLRQRSVEDRHEKARRGE